MTDNNIKDQVAMAQFVASLSVAYSCWLSANKKATITTWVTEFIDGYKQTIKYDEMSAEQRASASTALDQFKAMILQDRGDLK